MHSIRRAWIFPILALMAAPAAAEPGKGPVKVFLLAGQSNMQGYGHLRTLDWLGEDPQHGHLLQKIRKADGSWVERDDVWIYSRSGDGPVRKGNLTVGYGVNKDNIGPELMFGIVMGDHLDSPVLLIKTAWGGRSLALNFRPPSAGPPPLAGYPEGQRKKLEEAIQNKTLDVGKEYRTMVAETKDVLANLAAHFPQAKDQKYELAGFVWFQGWNDMISSEFTAEYARNLELLIKDLRKDLGQPNLSVVIAEMGVGGSKPSANVVRFRKAQAAGAAAFQGSVTLVDTARSWDDKAQAILDEGWKQNKWISKELEAKFSRMGSQPGYHYLGSARIHALMGRDLGQAMVELCKAAR